MEKYNLAQNIFYIRLHISTYLNIPKHRINVH